MSRLEYRINTMTPKQGKFRRNPEYGTYERHITHGGQTFACAIMKIPPRKGRKGGWAYGIGKLNQEQVLASPVFPSLKQAVAEAVEELNNIKVPVKNLMTGDMVLESLTTPYYCSVSSETYWSM